MNILDSSKDPMVRLYVNDRFMGFVSKLEYDGPAVKVPSTDEFDKFEPGNEITVSVQLTSPYIHQEKWRLLDGHERPQTGDQRWSNSLGQWLTINEGDVFTGYARYHIVRRKALVFV